MPSESQSRLAVVVEDDDSVREMICMLLESIGFQVLGCRDGREGLKAARERRPAVLTLDLHMPGIDGVDVLQQLNTDENTAEVPVVVVSAWTSDGRVKGCQQVKAIISKPFDVDDLCNKVCSAAGV